MQQLLLFQDSEENVLNREVKSLKDQCEKVRKGQYAKLSVLSQQVKDLQEELSFLKRAMCSIKEPKAQLELFPFAQYSKVQ